MKKKKLKRLTLNKINIAILKNKKAIRGGGIIESINAPCGEYDGTENGCWTNAGLCDEVTKYC
ncbi:hypothetical protein GCM10022258_41680 [Aquimarina gracilis]